MQTLRRLWNNPYVRHLCYAAAGALVLTWLLFFWLKVFTRHGKTQLVPDLTGLTVEEAQLVAKHRGLEVVVADSTYVGGRKRGTVVSHLPAQDEFVKRGRRIFITINAFNVPLVAMPNVTNISFRQAKVTLEGAGLRVGRMIYRPDPMKNYVLGQQYQGAAVAKGTPVPRGEAIDLVIGQGATNQTTIVPDMRQMTLEQATEALNNAYINAGTVNFAPDVRTYADSARARVYRQTPDKQATATMGSFVDLWLSLDPEAAQ